MADLCGHCREIPFSDLSCPTASDILKARQAAENMRFATSLPFSEPLGITWYLEDTKEIPLGSLGRIHRNKEHCGLCGLFYHVIQQRQQRTSPGINKTHLEDDDKITCTATISIFGLTTESVGDSSVTRSPSAYFPLKRLTLRTVFEKYFGENETGGKIFVRNPTMALYLNIAQTCHMDEFVHTEHSPREARADDQRMLFGGRERPDTVNLDLLRSWITICKTAHNLSCYPDEHPWGSGQARFGDS